MAIRHNLLYAFAFRSQCAPTTLLKVSTTCTPPCTLPLRKSLASRFATGELAPTGQLDSNHATRDKGQSPCHLPRRHRDQLRPRHHDADDAAVPSLQLGEVQAQESMEGSIRFAGQVSPGQVAHVLVVAALAVRVEGVAAIMAAQ